MHNLKSFNNSNEYFSFIIETNRNYLSIAQIDLLYEIDEIMDSDLSLRELINELDNIQEITCNEL